MVASLSFVAAAWAPLVMTALPMQADAEPSTAEQLESKQGEADAAEAQLQDLEEQLNAKANELAATQDAIASTEQDIEDTKEAIALKQGEVEDATDDLNDTVVRQYRTNSGSSASMLVDVLTSAQDMDQVVTGIAYSRRVSASQQQTIDQFVSARTDLEGQQAELEGKQAELRELESQQTQQQADLQEQVDAQQEYYDGLEQEVQDLMQKKAEEEAAAAQAEYERQQAEAAAAAAAAAAASGSPSGSYSVGTYSSAVDAAYSRIGCPYVWAAAGPSTFDCSGLVMWAYAQVGVNLPHFSGSQYSACSYHFTDMSLAQPGDLLFYGAGGTRHVAMYVGGGMMIEAPYTGAVVRVTSARTSGSFVGFGRL